MQNAEFLEYINIGLIMCALIVSLLVLVAIVIIRKIDEKGNHYQLLLAISNICLGISCMTEQIYTKRSGIAAHFLCDFGNFGQFLLPYIMTFLLCRYITFSMERNEKERVLSEKAGIDSDPVPVRHMHKVSAIVYCIVLIPVFTNPIHHQYYYINEANQYVRGNLFLVSQVIGLLMAALNVSMIIQYHRFLTRREIESFLMFEIIPVSGVFITLFFQGLYLMQVGMTISLMIIFYYLMVKRLEVFYKERNALMDTKKKLFYTRLLPYFLYNALDSIEKLCQTDAKQASVMTDMFAEYLRKNIDDIYTKDMIPFSSELEHIKKYISIEKLSYGDRLNVEYEISATSFSIPPLMLQPIVENDLKHGISPKKKGGSVYINTSLQVFEKSYESLPICV